MAEAAENGDPAPAVAVAVANAAAEAPPVREDQGDPIPAALHGRWGMTPADCTSTRGDAKGLLIVSGTDLRFYEARAIPTADVRRGDDSISGTFEFTGEGMTEERFQALQLQDGKLVRTGNGRAASFTYARCEDQAA